MKKIYDRDGELVGLVPSTEPETRQHQEMLRLMRKTARPSKWELTAKELTAKEFETLENVSHHLSVAARGLEQLLNNASMRLRKKQSR